MLLRNFEEYALQNTSVKLAGSKALLQSGFLLSLFFDHED
jgi:hypothetical protein